MPAPIRLYNTLSRQVEPLETVKPGHVNLYVCGMTVYDHFHVGHARAFVVFDTFVRYLRYRGWSVTFVRNYTDIDDKIIVRATERGIDPLALAQEFVDEFRADSNAMGLVPPDREPRVTESIPEIQALIHTLIDKGHAYLNEGTVWFSVRSCANYGRLSGQKPEDLRSADEQAGKRDPQDFALWKGAKPGEPAWDSAWGKGRPGWHIECSAMCKAAFGDTVDVHGGGLDLVFPHHENEIAQSESATGTTFSRLWMHNGLLTMSSGQKMGKSLGNVINARDALLEYPAEVLRLYYLQNHYRSPLPWDSDALPEALGMLGRLYDAREKAETYQGEGIPDNVAKELGADAMRVLELARAFPEAFHAAMDDDFNTSLALGLAFELARAMNRFGNHKKAAQRGAPIVARALEALRAFAAGTGLLCSDTATFQAEVREKRLRAMNLTPEDVERRLADRAAARAAKDWAKADQLRAELEAMSIVVMDRAGGGVEWRIRVALPE